MKEERKRKLAEAQQMREQKEFSTATSSSSENEAGSSELPDFLFGTDLSSKKIISTTTRETVSTSSNANRDPELLPVEPLPDSSSTEDNGADDVNLLDMDFGMAGPMSM